MTTISETAMPFRRTVAVYEMLTLLASAPNVATVFTSSASRATGYYSAGYYFVVGLIACGAIASAVAGWFLWRKRELGRQLSIALQWSLLLHFVWPGLGAFSMSLGLGTLVSWGTKPTGITAPAHIVVGLGASDADPYFGLNILALFALILLYWSRPSRPKAVALPGSAT